MNAVKDVPESFKQWVSDNSDRLNKAEAKGSVPYFIKDNKETVERIRTERKEAKPDKPTNEEMSYMQTVSDKPEEKIVETEIDFKKDSNNIEEVKIRRKQIKEKAKSLRDEDPIVHKDSNISMVLTGSGIDEFLNQPHKHYAEKNEMLLNIRSVIEKSTYIGVSTHKGKIAHIFETELCGEKTWIVATEVKGRGVSIYSISDSSKILEGIKKTT